MNCREVVELLLEYVEGELAAEQAEDVRRHLDACPPCVHYVETYRLTITLCRRLPGEPPPQAVLEKLRAATEDDTVTR